MPSGGKNGCPLLGNPFCFPRSGRPEPGLAMAARRHPFFSPPRAGRGMPVGLPLFLTKYPIFHWVYKVFCDSRLQVEFIFDQNTLFSPVFVRFLGISVATTFSTFSRIPCFPNVFLVFCDFWMGCQGRPRSWIWPDLVHPFLFPAEAGPAHG